MQSYLYPYSATATGSVNVSILRQEILDDGAIVTTLDSVSSDDGTSEIRIDFDAALSGAEVTALNAVVAAHQGEAFALDTQLASSLGTSSQAAATPATKVTLTSGPLIPGTYIVESFAELRLQAEVASQSALASLDVDATVISSTSNPQANFVPFMSRCYMTFVAGQKPVITMTFEPTGGGAVAEIRNAQISLTLLPYGV